MQEKINFCKIRCFPIKCLPLPCFVKSFMFADYLIPTREESFIVDRFIGNLNVPYKMETYRNQEKFPECEVVFMHVPVKYANQVEEVLSTSKSRLAHFIGGRAMENYDKVCDYINEIAYGH